MSEPVDIVAEMRDFAEQMRVLGDNGIVAPLPEVLDEWADHMERLQALPERMNELAERFRAIIARVENGDETAYFHWEHNEQEAVLGALGYFYGELLASSNPQTGNQNV